jgi:hypothetical protein
VSYAYAAGLQAAVYERLAGDPELAELVGGSIFDAPLELPPGTAEGDYIVLGEERVRANDTKTSDGAVHDFEVTVHSARDGFETVKRIAGSVCAALVDAPLALERGLLVGLRFLSARAERGPAPVKRTIALRFRAVIDGGN